MHRFTPSNVHEVRWFEVCAKEYLLSGHLEEICDHNSKIASKAGRNDVSKGAHNLNSFSFKNIAIKSHIKSQQLK